MCVNHVFFLRINILINSEQMKGMTYKDAYANALELLKKLGLESVKNKRLKDLSNGMQRRICLGMALIGESQVLRKKK